MTPGSRRVLFIHRLLGLLLFFLTSCRSPGTTVQIVNQTAGPIRTIEVIYPGGSYGIGRLARGGSHVKWIKPVNHGPLQIVFLDAAGQKHSVAKVPVRSGYAGGLAIVLLPDDKIRVEDHTRPPH
jgi:hypothetical protein